jgi:cytochrome P450
VFENIWKAQGRPEFMFFDTRPVQLPLFLITSHEMAEQVSRASKTQQYSVAKSPTVQQGFGELVGRYSLISENGEAWRGLRKTFNPGFAPQHLLSLLPVMVDRTRTLMGKLDALATSGVAAEMDGYCTDVTFDIIGGLVTNIDCKAQGDSEQVHDIVRNFRTLKNVYTGDNGLMASWMNPLLRAKKIIYSRRLDLAVKAYVKEKFADIKSAQDTKEKKDRSVLALALADVEELTPYILQSTADQVKSFLFAGHDTTSILLQRLFYALSIHPDCLAKIRAEHDAVFGDAEPHDVFLKRPDETMKALKYTSACIKEALRLWPPAASARMSHNGFKLRTSEGEDVAVDNCVIYLCHHIIQRDPKVYGETANDFVPERWVGDSDTSASTEDDGPSTGESKIPISAWRPFERGPRNCIGQELANMEARVILACVMRRYDFVKVGLGEVETDEAGQPVMDQTGKYKTKSELINVSYFSSYPDKYATDLIIDDVHHFKAS